MKVRSARFPRKIRQAIANGRIILVRSIFEHGCFADATNFDLVYMLSV